MNDIPDEARVAAVRAMNVHPAEASRALGDALEAAAPLIARAAQVAVLAEMEAQLRESFEASKILAYFEAAEQLRIKRVRLERGEGEQ